MPDQKQSILIGALVTALLGVLLAYFSQGGGQAAATVSGLVACCVPALAGSLMALWHYTDVYAVTLSTGEGARLGAVTAAVGSILSALLTYLLRFVGVFPDTEEQIEMMREEMVDQGMSPEQIDQALEFSQNFMSPLAQVGFVIAAVFIYALVGAGGGALGSALFKRGGDTPSIPRDL